MKLPALEVLHNTGVTALVANANRRVHTLPDGMVEEYADLEQLVTEHTDRWGRVQLDDDQRRALDRRMTTLANTISYGSADQVITDHLQPALAAFLDQVHADLTTAGRHALNPAVTVDMLDEPDDVRAAIVRLHSITPTYGALRTSWEICRNRSTSIQNADPLGIRSPLAEVANLPDLFADWEPAHHGRTPWPWATQVLHVKVGWLVANGARIWLPTTAEQNAAWHRYHRPATTAA